MYLIYLLSNLEDYVLLRDYQVRLFQLFMYSKYDLILEACAKFNVRCLDLIKILNTKDYYKIDGHPNSMGTEKIANFLYKKISAL